MFNLFRTDVYHLIDGERDYQDSKDLGPTGRNDGRQKSVGDYLTVIREYVSRADTAYTVNEGDGPALEVVRKIAAVCVQCMEVHGCKPREA
jgi:hypothetical protein